MQEKNEKNHTGNLAIKFGNLSPANKYIVKITDNAYKTPPIIAPLDTTGSTGAEKISSLTLVEVSTGTTLP